MTQQFSKTIHPSSLIHNDWIISQEEMKAGNLKVNHHIEKPGELYADRLSHHLLRVNMVTKSHRQVTRIGKQEYDGPLEDGAFFISAANDQPSFWTWDGIDEVVCFIIDPQRLRKIADECECNFSGEIALKNVVYGRDPQLKWFAKQFRAELKQNNIGERLYKDSLATLLELYILRNYCHQPLKIRQYDSKLGDSRLNAVLDYMNEHLAESISLEQLATVAGLSKHHFSHMFKKSVGIPPYRYLLHQRIERAKQYLKQDNLSISDIAVACGFADQSHLTRHFARATGTTPRKFREH